MLRFLFNIQGSSAPVSQITGEILVPFIVVALAVLLIVNIKRKSSALKTVFWMAFVVYCFALVELLFFPIPYKPSEFADVRYFSQPIANIIPFRDIFSAPPSIIIRNLIGNLIIFIPLGLSVPIIMKKGTKVRVFIFIVFSVALVVEFIQFLGSFIIFDLDWKIADIDDVIMNGIGGMIGVAIYLLIVRATARYNKEAV
jgi:glycopeptide antibiotics resistance protein